MTTDLCVYMGIYSVRPRAYVFAFVCVICYDVKRVLKMLHKSNNTSHRIHAHSRNIYNSLVSSLFLYYNVPSFYLYLLYIINVVVTFVFPLLVWVNTYLWWYNVDDDLVSATLEKNDSLVQIFWLCDTNRYRQTDRKYMIFGSVLNVLNVLYHY